MLMVVDTLESVHVIVIVLRIFILRAYNLDNGTTARQGDVDEGLNE